MIFLRRLRDIRRWWLDQMAEARARMSHATRRWRRTPRRTHRLLFVDDLLPDPAFGAGYPRAADMIRALSEAGWQVSIYPMEAEPAHYPPVRARVGAGVELLVSRGAPGLSRLLRRRAGDFNVVLVSRPGPMHAYRQVIERHPDIADAATCIYDAEALITHREVLRRELFGEAWSSEEAHAAVADEIALASPARAVLAVTASEAAAFARHLNIPAYVVGHGMPMRVEAPPLTGRRDFLFVGRAAGDPTKSPNVDSLIWFVSHVMPALDRLIGERYLLNVVGMADEAIRRRIASDRVVFHGMVDDTAPFYDRSRAFVAPTRFSAGLPHKLCETLSMGLPAVATDQLVAQMGLTAGVEVESAGSNDPLAFAQGCARLYRDDALWTRMQAAGLDRIRTDFSVAAFRRSVTAALEPYSDG